MIKLKFPVYNLQLNKPYTFTVPKYFLDTKTRNWNVTYYPGSTPGCFHKDFIRYSSKGDLFHLLGEQNLIHFLEGKEIKIIPLQKYNWARTNYNYYRTRVETDYSGHEFTLANFFFNDALTLMIKDCLDE
jgi:hypothetical protein